VGYDEGGQLTEAVRRRPFRVVLFDEIEKAHPDVFNVLLQILEDGRLTDGHGRTVDFRNTLVIMTSNLGNSNDARDPVGFLRDADDTDESHRMRASIDDALKRSFRPEFLNRIDEIIVFDTLTKGQIHQIVDLIVAEVQTRLLDHGVTIELTEAARDWLTGEGYDRVFGARPLRRAVQRHLENPLSKLILASDFVEGSHFIVDADESGLSFTHAGKLPGSTADSVPESVTV
jgi:ATP-dependent Clp protease ATP-binding subunit ClpC